MIPTPTLQTFAALTFPPWSLRIEHDPGRVDAPTAIAVYAGIKGPQALAVLAAHGSPTTPDDILRVAIIDNGCEFVFGFTEYADIYDFITDLRTCGRLPDVVAAPPADVIGCKNAGT